MNRLSFILILAATVVLAAPRALLPCGASACRISEAGQEAVAAGCCDRCHADATPGESVLPSAPRNSGGCDCPPGCPAPCGSGKLLYPPVGISQIPADVPLPRPLIAVQAAPRCNPCLSGLFRPPRA